MNVYLTQTLCNYSEIVRTFSVLCVTVFPNTLICWFSQKGSINTEIRASFKLTDWDKSYSSIRTYCPNIGQWWKLKIKYNNARTRTNLVVRILKISKYSLYASSPGGDVCTLTLCGELFQVLQSYFFVSRAVCQPVIDHRVLYGEKHYGHSNPQNKGGNTLDVSDYDDEALNLRSLYTHPDKNQGLTQGPFSTLVLWLWQRWAVTCCHGEGQTLTAPLQYRRIFPDGVRMMTDILFLELQERKVWARVRGRWY